MYSLKYRKFWLFAGGLLVLAVVYLSLAPPPLDVPPSSYDKIKHVTAYAVLMIWFCGIYLPKYFLRVGAMLLSLGLLLELLQGVVGHRIFEYRDLTANLAGILAGFFLCRYVLKGWCLRVERLAAR